jgi:hypothetical protein
VSRHVVVTCEGLCGCEMALDLKPYKADGGFHSCDIEYELRECGWTVHDGGEYCEECSAQPQPGDPK